MDWSSCLDEGEELCWQGRPAPRAYVFRNWKHSIFGLMLLLLAAYWTSVAWQLALVYEKPWLFVVPVPFLLIGLYLGIGHLLWSRLEWEKVFYAVTDRRLLARKGLLRTRLESFSLAELTGFRVKPLGAELATLRAHNLDTGKGITFTAVEQPRQVIALLESALIDNGHEVEVQPL